MNVTYPIAEEMLKRFQSRAGEPLAATDFLDLGKPAAIRQSLSRLVRQGLVRRVQRGLYQLPQMSKLLNRPAVPSPDKLVRAWARKNRLRVIPSGATAANLLGLSTQVPGKIVYYTNGRTKTLSLGPYTIRLRNRGPKTMDVRGQTAPLVLQALSYLGRDGTTREVISRLRATLRAEDMAELKANLQFAPAWMQLVLAGIAGEETD